MDLKDGDDCLHLVTVEGGIGVGKSTVMDALRQRHPSFVYIDEPVKEWEETGLLEHMYKGTVPPGTFQIAALATRMAPLLKAVREGHRVIVTERCPYSDLEVFTKANLEDCSVDLTAYKMAYDALMTAMPPTVYLYTIYLHADVDTLLQRMASRARDAEKTESHAAKSSRRAYLEKLQKRHDSFFEASANDLGVYRHSRSSVNAMLAANEVSTQVLAILEAFFPMKIRPLERKRPRAETEDNADKAESPSVQLR